MTLLQIALCLSLWIGVYQGSRILGRWIDRRAQHLKSWEEL